MGADAGHQQSAALAEASPTVLESGLVQTACIAVRHVDAAAVLQSTLLGPRKTGMIAGDSAGCSVQSSEGSQQSLTTEQLPLAFAIAL